MQNDSVRRALVSKSTMVDDLAALGLRPGQIVMAHTRMSSIGWVVGGAPTIVDALLSVLGPSGTLLVLTGWEDRPPYHQADWNEAEQRAYRAECPPFDPRVCRAERGHGRVPETVRTWPGAVHSAHPVGSFAAVGAHAAHLTAGQSLDEGYGIGSPLECLVELRGSVLLLGAPLETVTLLHYAEYRAAAPNKRYIEYEMPVRVDGRRTWRRIRELDSSLGAFRYENLDLAEDAFAVITQEAISAGLGRSGPVGAAEAHLLPAAELVDYAAGWLEGRFALDHPGRSPRS